MDMDKQEMDDLKKAYRKEKDLRVRAQILAVNMVCNEGFKINEAATCLDARSPDKTPRDARVLASTD